MSWRFHHDGGQSRVLNKNSFDLLAESDHRKQSHGLGSALRTIPWETICEIRRMHEKDAIGQTVIARKFGKNVCWIGQVLRYETRRLK